MPRAGLSPDAVADLALAVVDEGGPDGWAALTLSQVAARAGVAVPSLYKHVDGLPALRAVVAERCVDELTAALGEAVGGRRDTDALWALADATRAYALAHPGRYRAIQSAEAAGLGEAGARTVAVVAAVVGQLGAPPSRQIDAVRTVRAAIHGFVELELSGGYQLAEDVGASFRYLVGTLAAGLS